MAQIATTEHRIIILFFFIRLKNKVVVHFFDANVMPISTLQLQRYKKVHYYPNFFDFFCIVVAIMVLFMVL